MTLDYFYGQSGELFSYFRIPKALFQDHRFQQLSTDARTLYGILLDRMSLSAKNGWLDEQGRVYIIYTIREVQESLCCAEHKAVKLFRELEGIDLIERKRRGLGRPSLIYVKDFSSGLPKAQVQNCPNSNSGAAESAILVQPKPQANKTDKNKTERNDPDPMYNTLLQQDEKEAHHVATALEIYVKGSLNLFNHRTNVNVNNRIVCYDIKELGKQMKKLGMLIVQDQVWGRVTANRSSGKSTRYYMDEMHLLLKEEQTAAYSVEIWKRFRKWGGIPTGLTQNVKDLLSSREVENIFENSDMIIMLNQAAGDRQILAKQLNISPHQLSYVTHSGEGEGLLFFGNVILPFVDRFPTDLELYRIMTTKLGEVSEGAQK